MLEDFLQPLPPQIVTSADDSFGAKVRVYTDEIPDLEGIRLAIVGVPDGRYGKHNQSTALAPDSIRKAFYKLACHHPEIKMADLGNIKPGQTFDDSLMALKEVTTLLLQAGIAPIVIGGSMKLGLALYKAMPSENVECSVVSPAINLKEGGLLHAICTDEENKIFNLNVLGYQSHYTAPNHAHTMEKMFFTPIRLGVLKSKIIEAEPVLRNTDMLLFDVGAVKQADAPGNYYNNPSGLSAEEACQISWYAGIAEKLRIYGLFEVNPEFDYRDTTSKLGAQLLWYFIDGFYNRNGDHPLIHNEFVRYRCALNERHPDILFFKSKRTDRWWMEIPNLHDEGKKAKRVMIPCTYNDYQLATKGDMPDRFFNALQRMPK